LKNGSKIAITITQTIIQTIIITIGSITVESHFTITSISLLNLVEIFIKRLGSFPVCSQIFTIDASSKGK